MAGNESGEGEVACHAAVFFRTSAAQHALHSLPQSDGNQRLVLSLNQLAIPFEPTGVESRAQNVMNRTDRHSLSIIAVNEARLASHPRRIFQRILTGGVPLEQLRDDRCDDRINADDLLAISRRDVTVAERRLGGPDALLGLFLHAFARFLGQVVDVVLRH